MDERHFTSRSGPHPRSGGISLALAFISSSLVGRHDALGAAKTLLRGRCGSLVLVHCLPGRTCEGSMRTAMSALAAALTEETGVDTTCDVFKKPDGLTLEEALSDYVRAARPDLVIVSSSINTLTASELVGMRHAGQATCLKKPFHQSLALKLAEMAGAPALAPVLLISSSAKVPAAPKSTMQAAAATTLNSRPNSLNCLLDLQPTSRSVLDYLLNLLNPATDRIFLSVSNAYERPGALKLLSRRLLAGFAVQATISQFRPVQLAQRDPSHLSLPSVVADEKIDLLAFQAPRAKEFSPSLVSLLTNTAPCTSVLLWPPAQETSLRPSTADGVGSSFAGGYSRPSYMPLTPTPARESSLRPSTTDGINNSSAGGAGGNPRPSYIPPTPTPARETLLRPSTTDTIDNSFLGGFPRPSYIPLTPTKHSGRPVRVAFASDPGHQLIPELTAIPPLRTISGETGTGCRPGFRAFM